MTDARTTELEAILSEVALALFAPATVPQALQRIVDLAAATIDGCDAAGVFVVGDAGVVTIASSAPLVDELDHVQAAADQGPCIDAVATGRAMYAVDLDDDDRWPSFGRAAVAAGIRSVLAFRLPGPHPSALNLYARLPAAYGVQDRAIGSIFATLAGLALESAENRAEQEKTATNLHDALQTRELIGQAQGILMERERITSDQAFDVLRRASQRLNIKLRTVAASLVETGENPEATEPPVPS